MTVKGEALGARAVIAGALRGTGCTVTVEGREDDGTIVTSASNDHSEQSIQQTQTYMVWMIARLCQFPRC